MAFLNFIETLYGTFRGYNRLQIRKACKRNTQFEGANLAELQEHLLKHRIKHLAQNCPDYFNILNIPTPDSKETNLRFSNLPIWTREHQNQWFSQQMEAPVQGATAHATGGSTGEPTRLWISRESYEWRCAVTQRGYSWAGAEDGKKAVYVWGAPAKPLPKWKIAKQQFHHRLLGRHIFNSFDFGEDRMELCCELINTVKPDTIIGYSGNLIALSQYVEQYPDKLRWKAKTAVGGAEGMDSNQRLRLEKYLVDELFMSYGSREFMLIGMEHKDHDGYWLMDDNLYVEVVDDEGQVLPPGKSGRILVTDLNNYASPMIRYEIGDIGTMAEYDPKNPLPFRKLASVDGRSNEFIELPEGKRMTALFLPHLMKEFPAIRGYQIGQRNQLGMELHLVTDSPVDAQTDTEIKNAFYQYLPDNFSIEIKNATALKRKSNGKTPLVVEI